MAPMIRSIRNGSATSDWSDNCNPSLTEIIQTTSFLGMKKDKDKKGDKSDKKLKKKCCEKYKKGKRCKNCPLG